MTASKGICRRWTKEDDNFLEMAWGTRPYDSICRELGRTRNAIKERAYLLGLGPFLMAGQYVTLNQLYKAFAGTTFHGNNLESWKKRGFPVRYQTRGNYKCAVVKIEDFWTWAEQNRTFLDFSKLEPLALGKEPAWVDEQRKKDFRCPHRREPWTAAEQERLRHLLKLQKYSSLEISRLLGRTESSILYQCRKLNIKYRPIPASTRDHVWTDAERQILADSILSGDNFIQISAKLGVSECAIRRRMQVMYGTACRDKARKIIKEQEHLK